MARSKRNASNIEKEKDELTEFEAGVIRSIKQYKAGLVETFDDKDEFLESLRSSE